MRDRRRIPEVLLIALLITLIFITTSQARKSIRVERVYIVRSEITIINEGKNTINAHDLEVDVIPLFLNLTHQVSILRNIEVNGTRTKYTLIRDADGNPLALIKDKLIVRPKRRLTIAYEIEVHELYPKEYPSRGPNPERYLGGDGIWQTNEKELIELADRLYNSSSSPYEYLLKAISWIKAHVFYRGRIPPRYPIEVLREGMGDCDEQALLLGTLCRIKGIPAFLQVGALYTPGRSMTTTAYNGRWISITDNIGWHAWCMVYMTSKNGWIPVDLTAYSRNIPLPYAAIEGAPLLTKGTLVMGNISSVDYISEVRRFGEMLITNNITLIVRDSLILTGEELIVKPTKELLGMSTSTLSLAVITYLYLWKKEKRGREYMELFEAIRSRRSIRRFRDEDIPEEDLKKILEAAIWAPSAGNLQPWEFIVVKNEETKRRLAMAALGQMWMTTAPVIVVVCANLEKSAWRYGTRGRELYAIQDTAAAIENMLLAAHALGYGSCWVGAFDEDEVRRILNIPEGVRPVALIPIGRPAERPSPPSRIPLDRVVYGEEYGKRYFK